ncbi:MAG: Asp-tRNA(Asn)/Glu-tRNA(Gln) amidotransferase subunit GatC [Oligoflexia bacterium]|nr:Asp-tRNA(Asn)/Glu-tRNA(Gln) amidotransferase subunit GatC [Oligoflexia bacterium]
MEINHKILEKLSQLSALKINSPQEKQELKDYLTKTLSYFEQIKNIETKNIPPLISPFQPPLRLRADQVINFSDKEKLLEQAPQKQGNLIKTPASV